jgi:hypothetical protein
VLRRLGGQRNVHLLPDWDWPGTGHNSCAQFENRRAKPRAQATALIRSRAVLLDDPSSCQEGLVIDLPRDRAEGWTEDRPPLDRSPSRSRVTGLFSVVSSSLVSFSGRLRAAGGAPNGQGRRALVGSIPRHGARPRRKGGASDRILVGRGSVGGDDADCGGRQPGHSPFALNTYPSPPLASRRADACPPC